MPQLMLPGQAAAPDGPVDLTAMYLMHRAFRRDLDLFVAAAQATPTSDTTTWQRLAKRWELFSSTLHKHHEGEDAGLWPLLRERGADPAVLDAMAAEHEVIDPLLERCAAAFGALSRGKDNQHALSRDTEELRDALHEHLAHEERDAMVLVQAHLTPEDWDRLDREVFAAAYGPRDIPKVLAWVLHDLPADVIEGLSTMNAPLKAIGALLAGPFARAERRTFRYVPHENRINARTLAALARVFNRVHAAVYRGTGGRVGRRFNGGDVLLLTHRGRRSGKEYTVPLAYLRDGADLLVVASFGGADREPQWSLNLLADPRAAVELDGRRFDVKAEQVHGAERDALWARLVTHLPAYAAYQAGTRRRLAVHRLQPVA